MPEPDKTPTRLSLNIPESSRRELDDLVASTGRNITDLVRLGRGLAKVFHRETEAGNRIAVTTGDGTAIKELIVPGL
jgi:hypothetical protein